MLNRRNTTKAIKKITAVRIILKDVLKNDLLNRKRNTDIYKIEIQT